MNFYGNEVDISCNINNGKQIQIKVNGDVLGNKTVIKVVKNKVAPPFKTAEVEIMYGEGISKIGEVIDLAASMGIIDKSGAWFSYKGEKIGQGRENAKRYLTQHPEVMEEVTEAIKNSLNEVEE